MTKVLLLLGTVVAVVVFLYIRFLLQTMDVLFDVKEVGLGFENGEIQANLTISSQFFRELVSAVGPACSTAVSMFVHGRFIAVRYLFPLL